MMTSGGDDASIVIDDDLAELFGDVPFLSGSNVEQETHSPHGSRAGTDLSAGEELQEYQDDEVTQSFPFDSALNCAIIPQPLWNGMIAASYSRYRSTDDSLLLPWEVGACADIFQVDRSPRLPNIQPFYQPALRGDTPEAAIESDRVSFTLQTGVCYIHAVSDTRDLDYFEEKREKLELACGKWMDMLSTHWEASDVGLLVRQGLCQDPSGQEAVETLKACFGTKSPSTILKRASTLRKFLTWHFNEFESRDVHVHPLPLVESDVWQFFRFLRVEREAKQRGFTTAASFLETVRFCKFTIGLHGCDEVLHSGRLLGFAAIEKREKGPTVQAPILEMCHLMRLHEILSLGTNPIDRLGAGTMLLCVYGRARWSDLRFVHHVEVEGKRNGALVLYTREHKTSAVGLRREQYLPLVVPWEGVVSEDWISTLLQVYSLVGLNIQQVPLGPFLPAPKAGGGFCARPLRPRRLQNGLDCYWP